MAAPTVARAMKCDVKHCNTCLFDNYCKLCDEGWDTSGGKCYELLDHCVKQSVKDDGSRSCYECEKGWTHSYDDGKCHKMLDHCVKQSIKQNGDRRCYECEKGWVLESKLSIEKGDSRCFKQTVEHCRVKSEDDEKKEQESGLKQCSSCEIGYGVLHYYTINEENQCLPCEDKNAMDCYGYRESTKCKPGYSLGDVPGKGARFCFKNIANCADYEGEKNTDGWCSKCEDGYTLTADKKTCEKGTVCPENATCSGGNVTCNSGYELKNGVCVKKITCPANCTACSSSTVCTTCAAGYSLIGGKCVAGTVAQCPSDSSMSSDGCCCIPQ